MQYGLMTLIFLGISYLYTNIHIVVYDMIIFKYGQPRITSLYAPVPLLVVQNSYTKTRVNKPWSTLLLTEYRVLRYKLISAGCHKQGCDQCWMQSNSILTVALFSKATYLLYSGDYACNRDRNLVLLLTLIEIYTYAICFKIFMFSLETSKVLVRADGVKVHNICLFPKRFRFFKNNFQAFCTWCIFFE